MALSDHDLGGVGGSNVSSGSSGTSGGSNVSSGGYSGSSKASESFGATVGIGGSSGLGGIGGSNAGSRSTGTTTRSPTVAAAPMSNSIVQAIGQLGMTNPTGDWNATPSSSKYSAPSTSSMGMSFAGPSPAARASSAPTGLSGYGDAVSTAGSSPNLSSLSPASSFGRYGAVASPSVSAPSAASSFGRYGAVNPSSVSPAIDTQVPSIDTSYQMRYNPGSLKNAWGIVGSRIEAMNPNVDFSGYTPSQVGEIFSRTVSGEAADQGDFGMMAVANNMANRMALSNTGNFPSATSFRDVMAAYDANGIRKGTSINSPYASNDYQTQMNALNAAQSALSPNSGINQARSNPAVAADVGSYYGISPEAVRNIAESTHYYQPSAANPNWAKDLVDVGRYKGHIFGRVDFTPAQMAEVAQNRLADTTNSPSAALPNPVLADPYPGLMTPEQESYIADAIKRAVDVMRLVNQRAARTSDDALYGRPSGGRADGGRVAYATGGPMSDNGFRDSSSVGSYGAATSAGEGGSSASNLLNAARTATTTSTPSTTASSTKSWLDNIPMLTPDQLKGAPLTYTPMTYPQLNAVAPIDYGAFSSAMGNILSEGPSYQYSSAPAPQYPAIWSTMASGQPLAPNIAQSFNQAVPQFAGYHNHPYQRPITNVFNLPGIDYSQDTQAMAAGGQATNGNNSVSNALRLIKG